MVHAKKRNDNFVKNKEIHGESNVWSTAQRYKKAKDLMLKTWRNEATHQSAMSHILLCQGHMLRKDDVCVLRKALELEIESQKKGRLKGIWKNQVEEESMEDGLSIGLP